MYIESAKVAGTKKNYRNYNRYFPSELYGALPQPNQISHLYEVVMKNHFESSQQNAHLKMAFETESSFGIVTSKLLPAISNFPLYMHQGKVTVSIRHIRSGIFIDSHDHFQQLYNFHVMVFRDILKVFKYFMSCDNSNEENSFLLVPLLSSTNINWDVVESFQNLADTFVPSPMEKRRKKYVASEWIGKVVTPLYSNKEVKYMVVKVNENMTPLTPFPKPTYESYKDYVESVYQQKVERTDTFMIEVKGITENMKFFAPGQGQGGSKKKSSDTFVINLIPELCHNFTFPADLWVKCKLLPSVLHRVNSLLVAEHLRTTLNGFVGVACQEDYLPASLQGDVADMDYEHLDESFDRVGHMKNGKF